MKPAVCSLRLRQYSGGELWGEISERSGGGVRWWGSKKIRRETIFGPFMIHVVLWLFGILVFLL